MTMPWHLQEHALFDRLRAAMGIRKPIAASSRGWKEWEKTARAEHPFGYWVTESLPETLDDIVKKAVEPFSDFKHYCINRFVNRTHMLPTGLRKGAYNPMPLRLMHGMMRAVVDHVEIDLAGSRMAMETDLEYDVVEGRCRQAGLDHLAWEATLDDPVLPEGERSPEHAKAAREIIELYLWWKDVRPLRPNPSEVSGWSEFCRTHEDTIFETAPEDYETKHSIMEKLQELKAADAAEDERMLCRVVGIREYLND